MNFVGLIVSMIFFCGQLLPMIPPTFIRVLTTLPFHLLNLPGFRVGCLWFIYLCLLLPIWRLGGEGPPPTTFPTPCHGGSCCNIPTTTTLLPWKEITTRSVLHATTTHLPWLDSQIPTTFPSFIYSYYYVHGCAFTRFGHLHGDLIGDY